MKQTKYNLFINWYLDANPNRNLEYDRCLLANLSNENIEKVIVIIQENQLDNAREFLFKKVEYSSKLFVVVKKERPTYNDFFSIMSKYENVILANGDIIITNTPKIPKNTCWALLRYEEDDSGKLFFMFEREDSQDTWWFDKCPPYVDGADFLLGVPGCDNAIANCFAELGYDVRNPCRTVKTIHVHNSGVRNYDWDNDRVTAKYLWLPLVELKFEAENVMYE